MNRRVGERLEVEDEGQRWDQIFRGSATDGAPCGIGELTCTAIVLIFFLADPTCGKSFLIFSDSVLVFPASDPTRTATGKTRTVTDQTRTRTKKIRTVVDPIRTRTEKIRTVVDPMRTATEKIRTVSEKTRTAAGKIRFAIEKIRTATDPISAAIPQPAEFGMRKAGGKGRKREAEGGGRNEDSPASQRSGSGGCVTRGIARFSGWDTRLYMWDDKTFLSSRVAGLGDRTDPSRPSARALGYCQENCRATAPVAVIRSGGKPPALQWQI